MPEVREMRPRLIVIGLLPLALAACMSAHPPLGLPDASVIGFDGHEAIPPDCAALDQPATLIDAGHARPGMAFGCATYTNLAAMLARPADLVQPQPYAGAEASMASSAVRRFEENRIKQPNVTSTTARTGQ
ncbi:CpaD family pilus assembly lipoprotein [Paraburkholderia mimosarum]|uniref:CpaD family pilus assembly lipoprotein n=1 Tax=Paraburkholderia mimosarum TaxID=312026 RepID=UPI0039C38C0E